MTAALEGILVRGPYVVVTFQGPKGTLVDKLWLVANGLIEMLGGMEDEVLNPGDGM